MTSAGGGVAGMHQSIKPLDGLPQIGGREADRLAVKPRKKRKLKETFAGIVHGGIMGVMGGSTRPFLAARHSRLLKTIDNFEAQKKLTGASQGRLLKLKDKLKYTGAYSQYATDVAGLTLGDITGTAVAYGQIKSGEEMMMYWEENLKF